MNVYWSVYDEFYMNGSTGFENTFMGLHKKKLRLKLFYGLGFCFSPDKR